MTPIAPFGAHARSIRGGSGVERTCARQVTLVALTWRKLVDAARVILEKRIPIHRVQTSLEANGHPSGDFTSSLSAKRHLARPEVEIGKVTCTAGSRLLRRRLGILRIVFV